MALEDNNKVVFDIYNNASLTPVQSVEHPDAIKNSGVGGEFVRFSNIANRTVFAWGFGMRTLIRDRQLGVTGVEFRYRERAEGPAGT